MCAPLLSHVWLFATLWTVAFQAPSVHGIIPRTQGGCHFLLQHNRIDSPEINPCIYGQFPTVEPRIYNEKIGSSISGVGKTGQPHNINSETGLLFYTTDKNQLKIHWGLQYKTWNGKTRRKIGISTLTLVLTVFWIWNQKQT